MQIKAFIKELLPPVLLKFLKSLIYRPHNTVNSTAPEPVIVEPVAPPIHQGPYPSWDDALANSDGYDAQVILDKTLAATLKVKSGEAVFERDSFLYDKPEYPYFVISSLLYIFLIKKAKLSILDFGGSLGSTFFQIRKFTRPLDNLKWSVVEQKKHVTAGRQYLENDHLRFYYTIQECLSSEKPDVALLSGVLHIVENPYEVIEAIQKSEIDYVIVDRQPLSPNDMEQVYVKNVPPYIYAASYPMWVLSESRFRNTWSDYKLEAEDEEFIKLEVTPTEILTRRRFLYSRRKD